MRIRLTVVRGKTDKKSVQLLLPAVIGRSREADLTIVHPMISRRHCELREEGGLVRVRDLGALNGTFLGDRQIHDEIVRPGDLLTIGPMTFEVDYEPKPSSESTDKCHVGPLSEEQLSDMVVGSGVASSHSRERHYDLETEPQPAATAALEENAESPGEAEPATSPPELPAVAPQNEQEFSVDGEAKQGDGPDDVSAPSIAPEPGESDSDVQISPDAADDTEVEKPEASPETTDEADTEPPGIAPPDGALPDFSALAAAWDNPPYEVSSEPTSPVVTGEASDTEPVEAAGASEEAPAADDVEQDALPSDEQPDIAIRPSFSTPTKPASTSNDRSGKGWWPFSRR
ncbi:hypothetical protein JCM19992_33970 [Thermostilla marina]